VAQISRTVREYLADLALENSVAEHEENPPAHDSVVARYISTTDPDACWASNFGAAVPSYYDLYLIDNASCIILGVEATWARFRQETLAARRMLAQVKERFSVCPESLGADRPTAAESF